MVCLLLGIRWAAQLREPPPSGLPGMEGLPSWWWQVGSPQDWVVFGYDAEQWLHQAAALAEGGIYQGWRPPLWPLAVAGLSHLFGDIAVAGHMLNHLLSAGACLLVYALGKSMGGRAVGAAASLIMACVPFFNTARQDFSIDAAFQLMPAGVVLCCWLVARGRFWTLLLAAVAVAAAWLTHVFLGLYCLGGWGLLLLARRPWRWRLAAALLVPVFALLLLKGTLALTDTAGWEPPRAIAQYLGHALTANFQGAQGQEEQSIGSSLLVALDRLPKNPLLLAGQPLYPFSSTWLKVSVLLFWLLGIMGPGLRTAAAAPGRWDWRPGLWLLVMQAPIFLSATAGPLGQRYGAVGLPFFYIAVGRGLAVAATAAAGVPGRLGVTLPRRELAAGALAMVLALALPLSQLPRWTHEWRYSRLPKETLQAAVQERLIAREIRRLFGPGDHLVSASLDAVAGHTARKPCEPEACIQGDGIQWPACAAGILKSCVGRWQPDGTHHKPDIQPPIPCLVRIPAHGSSGPDAPRTGPREAAQVRLASALHERLQPLKTWRISGEEIRLYRLDPAWLRAFSP